MPAVRELLIAPLILWVAGCGAVRGPAAESQSVIPWFSTPPEVDLNPITSPVQLLSAPAAANAVKLTVAQVQPLLLPTAMPPGSEAHLAADPSQFSVTYVSKATAQRIFFGVGIQGAPALGPRSAVTSRMFRNAQARYSVDELAAPTAYRRLTWTEPGTWIEQASPSGVPYVLTATGFTEPQFWQLADSIDAIPWPPAPRPCGSTDLVAVYGGGNGATGHVIDVVLLSNRGTTACSLQGFPRLSLASLEGSVLAPRQVDANPTGPLAAGPVILHPDSTPPVPHQQAEASFVFELYYCPERAAPVSELVLELPAGGGKMVVPFDQPGNGGFGSSRCEDGPPDGHVLYVGPFRSAANQRTVSPPAQLAVSILAPASIVAGQALRYQVTLTNLSDAPFHFDMCPSYREAMDSIPRKEVAAIYQLNCAPVGTMAPGGTLTFAMVLDIPTDAPTGPQELSWRVGPFLSDASASAGIVISGR